MQERRDHAGLHAEQLNRAAGGSVEVTPFCGLLRPLQGRCYGLQLPALQGLWARTCAEQQGIGPWHRDGPVAQPARWEAALWVWSTPREALPCQGALPETG